jgi:hypothetical protein
MIPTNDPYEAWKRQRADVPVPHDFADRVLAELRRREERALVRSRAAQVALGSLAGAVFLCRLLQFVVLFLTEHACQ